MTAVGKELQEIESDILSYRNMRDGWRVHSERWESYDLVMRVLMKTYDRLAARIPIEKQDLQRAFEAGKDSKVFMVETEFEIQYDYLETFDQFYNELKGE